MECLLLLVRRLADLASHPLGFLYMYRDYATSLAGNHFIHGLPPLVMLGAVAYRLYCSKEINRICRKLCCRLNKNVYYLCNILCVHWLLNMTLVSFLSLQDFVYCATRSHCDQQPSFPVLLWTERVPCSTAPSNLGLAIMASVAVVGGFILWQPEILFGYVENRLKQRHALAHWVIAKIKPRFGAPVATTDSSSQVDHDFKNECELLKNDVPNNSIPEEDNNLEN